MRRWRFSPRRFGAILVKETLQMLRDRVTFAMMIGVPIMQLVLFGFAINNDPKHLDAALVATSQDHLTRAVVTSLENTGYYRFTHVTDSAAEAEAQLASGAVSFVVTVPSDFSRRVMRGDRPRILIEADGTDPSVASGAISTLGTLAQTALNRELGIAPETAQGPNPSLEIVVHRRYNPEGITQYNIVPGLLGVILQMTTVMLTAFAVTREVERGTMENLLALPASPMEIMLGKVVPALGVGAVQVFIVLASAKLLFDVPFVGSLWLLLSGVLLFVLALIFLGYFISTFARTLMQAMQLTTFFFLPSLLLSGFMFPYRGMPVWAQWLGEVFPLTHFNRLIRSVMLKGGDFEAVSGPFTALVLFSLGFAAVALMRFRRTLD
ncbi:ABC transporter permease [Pseudaestuariivita atlantica]|uniref:Mannose-1-phosphate guanyltransferase n=1 Tax=Pseudaestuariivita atlantica TaxID=1317121 RepID=A0A0L1JT51_9RHOB|nr:ABC transporter permease [Pseudaestuariivita atlantica]KNG94593.1 mannose-1-phosphate guanyltransferase [Pseudaestuariivita atlantica]